MGCGEWVRFVVLVLGIPRVGGFPKVKIGDALALRPIGGICSVPIQSSKGLFPGVTQQRVLPGVPDPKGML